MGALRDKLLATMDAEGCNMTALTVMSEHRDPYRIDTPANHRDAEWLAEALVRLGVGARKIHNRGLHYMILGQVKPDGSEYVSDDECWVFLQNASKYARWLGYVPFDQITDERNSPPVVRTFVQADPRPYLTVGLEVELPPVEDITPEIDVYGFRGTQPYKLVMVGEKSSLDDVLGPIAEQYEADLFLPTGDVSDTMVHQIATIGAKDGRRMVVLYFADADPSGHNMGNIISRKLQAFKDLALRTDKDRYLGRDEDGDMQWEPITLAGLDFEVHRVALTVPQVREYGLPSTPIKETEKRGDKWRQAFGVEQTEIDALATLRPDVLRRITHDAIRPFYDDSLTRRVFEARNEWAEAAQARLDAVINQDRLAQIRAEAAEKLAAMRDQIDELNAQLQIDISDVDDLPPFEIPQPELDGDTPEPLIDSDAPFPEQTRRLIADKRYELNNETPAVS